MIDAGSSQDAIVSVVDWRAMSVWALGSVAAAFVLQLLLGQIILDIWRGAVLPWLGSLFGFLGPIPSRSAMKSQIIALLEKERSLESLLLRTLEERDHYQSRAMIVERQLRSLGIPFRPGAKFEYLMMAPGNDAAVSMSLELEDTQVEHDCEREQLDDLE